MNIVINGVMVILNLLVKKSFSIYGVLVHNLPCHLIYAGLLLIWTATLDHSKECRLFIRDSDIQHVTCSCYEVILQYDEQSI